VGGGQRVVGNTRSNSNTHQASTHSTLDDAAIEEIAVKSSRDILADAGNARVHKMLLVLYTHTGTLNQIASNAHKFSHHYT